MRVCLNLTRVGWVCMPGRGVTAQGAAYPHRRQEKAKTSCNQRTGGTIQPNKRTSGSCGSPEHGEEWDEPLPSPVGVTRLPALGVLPGTLSPAAVACASQPAWPTGHVCTAERGSRSSCRCTKGTCRTALPGLGEGGAVCSQWLCRCSCSVKSASPKRERNAALIPALAVQPRAPWARPRAVRGEPKQGIGFQGTGAAGTHQGAQLDSAPGSGPGSSGCRPPAA